MAESRSPQEESSPESTGMIPVNTDNALSLFLSEGELSLSNFPADPMERFRLESIAEGPEALPGDQQTDPFEVKYWYAHPIEMMEDDGEVRTAIRVVLIDPEGKAIRFVSQGIVRDLVRIVRAFGREALPPGLKVRVQRARTRRGFNILRLALADCPAPAAKPKTR